MVPISNCSPNCPSPCTREKAPSICLWVRSEATSLVITKAGTGSQPDPGLNAALPLISYCLWAKLLSLSSLFWKWGHWYLRGLVVRVIWEDLCQVPSAVPHTQWLLVKLRTGTTPLASRRERHMLLTVGPSQKREIYHPLFLPFNPPTAQLSQLSLSILKLQSSSGRLTDLHQK